HTGLSALGDHHRRIRCGRQWPMTAVRSPFRVSAQVVAGETPAGVPSQRNTALENLSSQLLRVRVLWRWLLPRVLIILQWEIMTSRVVLVSVDRENNSGLCCRPFR